MNLKKLIYISSIIFVVILLMIWEYAVHINKLSAVILPPPSEIFLALKRQVISGALFRHITASFKRVMLGYFFGSLFGIVLGFVLYAFPKLSDFLQFPLGLVRPIPSMALFPIFILWLGIGETSKIVVIAFVAFWPVFLNTEEGVRQTDKNLVELSQVLRKNRLRKITSIIIPSTIPYIFSGLRLGISRSWGGVVVAEMLAASSGIGFLIEYSREMSQSAVMFMSVIVIALIGFFIDVILKLVQKKICFWSKEL